MKRKSPNLSIQWKEFKKEKEVLLSSDEMRRKVAIYADLDNPKGTFRNLNFRTTYLKYRQMNKGIISFTNDFEKLDRIVGFQKKDISENLYKVKDAFDTAVKNLDAWDSEVPPVEAMATNKRGPKIYPDFLAEWIFNVIESAKGDKIKLAELIKFFRPRGEFDKWLQKTSNGFWSGPSKKPHANDEAIDSSMEKDMKWLNDIKKTQHRNIRKR